GPVGRTFLSASENQDSHASAEPNPKSQIPNPKSLTHWWLNKRGYLVGLLVFSLAVVGYTLIGGFLAAVWTDLLQSVMMFIGVMILVCLALPAAGGLERATREAINHAGPQFATGPAYKADGSPFLPLTMAFSMFCFWPFAGTASPASVVRVMACKNTGVLKRSIF